MNFLLFGYGSIGKRHATILHSFGHAVITVDPNPATGADYQSQQESGLQWAVDEFGGILICTPANVREQIILEVNARLTLFDGSWFIEKPLGHQLGPRIIEQLEQGKPTQVGFCYYYASGLQGFATAVQESTVYSVSIIGGQWLPDWSTTDYRKRYHGTPGQGGVILDSLPHSLYIARWILGELSVVGSVTGKLSDLEIETEDTAAVLLESESGTPCYLLADYLRRPRAFWIEAVCSDGWRRWEFDVNDAQGMYERQMVDFVSLCNGSLARGPNLADGVAVEILLDAIKAR